MKQLLLWICLSLCWTLSAREPVKVACIGNSITYGALLEHPETDSYPSQLQMMLGADYQVMNFGKSGATLLNKGHRPYMQQSEFREALAFAGDIVVIHLGVNDTDPRDWPNYRDDFVKDYKKLIDSFRAAKPTCRILIARLTPIFDWHPRFQSGTRDWQGDIQHMIDDVARICNVECIDFHTPLYAHPNWLPDAIHPNKEGAKSLAKTVYEAITGDFGGLQLPAIYTDNMVIQHNQPLLIQGRANAKEPIEVCIGKQKVGTVTGKDGRWKVALQPLEVGKTYTLTISSPTCRKTYKNIVAGEVWLCSGQSNMEFTVQEALKDDRLYKEMPKQAIRLFNLKGKWATNAVVWSPEVLDSVNHLHYYQSAVWEECTPDAANKFSAVAYYFGKQLQDSLKVPIGLICNAVGGSPTEAWIDRSTLERSFPLILKDWLHNDFIHSWVRERAALNLRKATDKRQRHPYEPCYLYETGIDPFTSFPIKGVIWYQGESNAHNMDVHSRLFSLLVQSWRTQWKQPDLPFYYVQLSSMDRPTWGWFRDSQRRLLSHLDQVGMAVSSDYGDSLNVHPRNKRPIGERLARWALSKTYHFDAVVPSGPLFRQASAKDGAVYVTFHYAEGLTTSDGQPIRTFEIAEYEGLFFPARAEILENGTIRLTSPQVSHPRFVRYAWQPFTRANLVNRDGLPASTFRGEVSK